MSYNLTKISNYMRRKQGENKQKIDDCEIIACIQVLESVSEQSIRRNYKCYKDVIDFLEDSNIIKKIKGKRILIDDNAYWLLANDNLRFANSKKFDDLCSKYWRLTKEPYSLSYFKRHTNEIEEYEIYLDKIYSYLFHCLDKPFLTANELGVYLFNDEKAFEQGNNSSIGKALSTIKKCNISENDLNCWITCNPLYHEYNSNCLSSKNVLVVENKDMYWSFIFNDFFGLDFRMVIYGEGKQIGNDFTSALFKRLNISKHDRIYYFGDIDPEGFSIYRTFKLKNIELFDISLFHEGYMCLVEHSSSSEIRPIKNSQNILLEELFIFLKNELNFELLERIKWILENGFYIPQEKYGLLKRGIK